MVTAGSSSSRDIRSGDPEEWNFVDHKWSVEGTHHTLLTGHSSSSGLSAAIKIIKSLPNFPDSVIFDSNVSDLRESFAATLLKTVKRL